MTDRELEAALRRYRVPLAAELPGARAAIALADLVRTYFTTQDAAVRERLELTLPWIVGLGVPAPDRVEQALRDIGSEHEPDPDWQAKVWERIATSCSAPVCPEHRREQDNRDIERERLHLADDTLDTDPRDP